MFFTSNTVTLDLSEQEFDQRIMPCPPVLSSHVLNWEGIYVQQHRQPAWETPECSHPQHKILVHTVTSSARIERRLNGCRWDEQIIRGDIVLLPAGAQHQVSWDREIECTFLFLEPAYIAQIAREEIDRESVEFVPRFAQPDPLIYQIGLGLKRELESGEQSSRFYVEAATMMLAAHLFRHYSTRQLSLPTNVGGLSGASLNQAIEYIDAHLTEGLSVSKIAASVSMSQYHFTRLFKQSIGVSPYQYVIQRRVAFAKQLLASPNLSIAQVSQQLGFYTPNQFSHFFRKHVGFSPKEYQQGR